MKGYKAFDSNLTCRNFKYEIGHTYEMEDKPVICEKGFHFCKSITDTYKYYPKIDSTRICEVEALGDVVTDDNIKFCTNKIRIVREITDSAKRKGNVNSSSSGFCNSGNRNSGNCNSGDWNSGNRNSGNRNSGYCNSGNRNSGNRNSGNCNSGDWNSGDWNSGNHNSGNCNSGDCNSGNCNSGDWNLSSNNSGCFCTEKHNIKMFDKDCAWNYADWRRSNARHILLDCPWPITIVKWIRESEMTDKEKDENPSYKTTGGYLKITGKKLNRQEWWDSLTEEDRDTVKALPNFDAKKFYKCTGIRA